MNSYTHRSLQKETNITPPQNQYLSSSQIAEASLNGYPNPSELCIYESQNELHPGRRFVGTPERDFCYWVGDVIPFGFIRTKGGKLINKSQLKPRTSPLNQNSTLVNFQVEQIKKDQYEFEQRMDQKNYGLEQQIHSLEIRIEELEKVIHQNYP